MMLIATICALLFIRAIVAIKIEQLRIKGCRSPFWNTFGHNSWTVGLWSRNYISVTYFPNGGKRRSILLPKWIFFPGEWKRILSSLEK